MKNILLSIVLASAAFVSLNANTQEEVVIEEVATVIAENVQEELEKRCPSACNGPESACEEAKTSTEDSLDK